MSGSGILGRRWRSAAACLCAAMVGLAGCGDYPQGSPDELLQSARQMVADGRADRLTKLVWTDDPGMRRVLGRVGRLLGRLQDLGDLIAETYPEEIDELRRQAEAAAARGEGASMIAQALTGRRERQQRPSGDIEQRLNLMIREVFADPYGWLQRSEGRLTPEYITDDIVGLAWDGHGVIGVRLVERDGKWYIDSPTNLAVVRQFFPEEQDAHRILESLVATLDNAVRDLAADIRSGEIRTLAGVSAEAGEKAAPMFIFGAIAYGKYLEQRDKPPAPPPGS
ncbi:MAG: hypothetical protein ACF8R7_09100 [Phycisphaerales bacterium JB039]